MLCSLSSCDIAWPALSVAWNKKDGAAGTGSTGCAISSGLVSWLTAGAAAKAALGLCLAPLLRLCLCPGWQPNHF